MNLNYKSFNIVASLFQFHVIHIVLFSILFCYVFCIFVHLCIFLYIYIFISRNLYLQNRFLFSMTKKLNRSVLENNNQLINL